MIWDIAAGLAILLGAGGIRRLAGRASREARPGPRGGCRELVRRARPRPVGLPARGGPALGRGCGAVQRREGLLAVREGGGGRRALRRGGRRGRSNRI